MFFAEIKYEMFPEMEREFKNLNIPKDKPIILPLEEDEYSENYYFADIELPFGTLETKLKYREDNAEDEKL